jgi:hypothetical protein
LITAVDHRVTVLGRAIATSSLSIDEGLSIAADIRMVQEDICLSDEIHLLYLCVAPQMGVLVKPEPYNSTNWLRIFEKHRHVIKLLTGLSDVKLDRMQDLPVIRGGLGRIDPVIDGCFDRIYIAVILRELINEAPLQEITRRFGVDRGTIQAMQMQCATFAAQTAKFCELLGSELLAGALNRFRPRLNFAARTELLGLLVLPSCTKDIARVFVQSGITSAVELAGLTVDMIAGILNPDESARRVDHEIVVAIHRNAVAYTESLTRLESLEEIALQNVT